MYRFKRQLWCASTTVPTHVVEPSELLYLETLEASQTEDFTSSITCLSLQFLLLFLGSVY